MKRQATLCCILVVALVATADGQITFNRSILDQLRGITYSTRFYTMDSQHYPAMEAIVAQTGDDQTWDFTPYTFGLAQHVILPVYVSPAGTPGENDSYFAGSNFVQFLDYGGGSGFWSYYDLSNDGYDYLGSIFISGFGQQVNKNSPPDRIYAFPMTDGTTWDQNIVVNTVGFGIEQNRNVNEHNVVDGWGTLTTPMGSAPCIRLRKTRVDEVAGKTAVTIDTYSFITNTGLAASISYNSSVSGISTVTYSIVEGTSTGVEEVPIGDFRLEQNFPNPFSRSTIISFELDRPSNADLRVFDLMGREVAELVAGMLPAGTHSSTLSAEGLSDGVYLYRLLVDGVPTTRSLTLLKQ